MKNEIRVLSMAARLYCLVGAFVLITAIAGVLSFQTLSRLKVNGPVYAGIVQQKDLLGDILPPPVYILESYSTVLQIVGESDPNALKEEIDKLRSLKRDFDERTEFWTKELADSPVRRTITEDSHKPAVAFFETLDREFIPAVQKHDKQSATLIAYGKLQSHYLEHRKAIDQAVSLATQNSQHFENAAATEIRRRTAVLVTVLLGGLVLVGLYGLHTTRSLVRIVKSAAERLSEGSDQVVSAAAQVSAASQSLAEGASEQAASLEETSSSLEEMSSMTKRNAENSKQANELAKQTREAAEKGATDMQDMSRAMGAIKDSSDDIAKIIKTIDEIAFQTNILALNAAVEAARAGEAGMGFAVVAEEVRSLAQRSAQAAKETSAKIEGAIGKASQGVAISTTVAQTLQDILTRSRQVDELAAEVASASHEQSQGITQVNQAVGQMDKLTQNNAANAEETASAAEELNAQAEVMQGSVAKLINLVGAKGQVASLEHPIREREPSVKKLAMNRCNVHGRHSVRKTTTGSATGSSTSATGQESIPCSRSEIPLAGEFKNF